MEKKEMKKFINDNGFFLQITDVEKLDKDAMLQFPVQGTKEGVIPIPSVNPIDTKETPVAEIVSESNVNVPIGPNVILFKGKATQKFDKGESSRNEYKIDVDGWDWDNYIKNPQILLQHDDNKPIGKAIKIYPREDGVDILYYVDLNTMDKEDSYKVANGFFSGLSTGHITKELMFENNKTGKRITEQEFFAGSFEWEDFTKVVTKAEACEISVVSIPSNPDALTFKNSLSKLFNNKTMEIKKNEAGIAEVVEEATPIEPNTAENAEEETAENADISETESEVETPEVESEAENAEEEAEEVEAEEEVEEPNNEVEDLKALTNSLIDQNKSLSNCIIKLAEEFDSVSSKFDSLKNDFDKIPAKQSISTQSKVRKENRSNPVAEALQKGLWTNR